MLLMLRPDGSDSLDSDHLTEVCDRSNGFVKFLVWLGQDRGYQSNQEEVLSVYELLEELIFHSPHQQTRQHFPCDTSDTKICTAMAEELCSPDETLSSR
jgi:hypothetical protein